MPVDRSVPVRPAERRTLRMRLSRALLRLLGWRLIDRPPATEKYVVVAAWHTSNWDFVFALLVLGGLGLRANFLGKRELVEGPFGSVMKALGVIGVDRSRSTGLTSRVAELFEEREHLILVVPAEGTRSATERWKSGFYYMALAADVPIAFGFLDAATRTVGIDGGFVPSGDLEADTQILRAFYGPKRGLDAANMGPIAFGPASAQKAPDDVGGPGDPGGVGSDRTRRVGGAAGDHGRDDGTDGSDGGGDVRARIRGSSAIDAGTESEKSRPSPNDG